MKTPKTTVFDLYNGILKRDQKAEICLSALKQILDIVYVRTVREEAGGTYGVGSRAGISRILDGQAMLQIFFDTDSEKVEAISPIIDREIRKIVDNGSEDSDFLKVKEYMIKKFQEDEKTNDYRNGILSTYYLYNEDNYSNYLSIVNALTKDDIKNVTE